jgi:hypothetical protein
VRSFVAGVRRPRAQPSRDRRNGRASASRAAVARSSLGACVGLARSRRAIVVMGVPFDVRRILG